MRTFSRLACTGLSLFAVAGCGASTDVPLDGVFSETIGSVERVRPGDVTSPWIGEERVRIVDGLGELLCEGDVDLDAIDSRQDGCIGCEVTLDVVRSTVKDLAEDCSFVVDAAQAGTTSRYLAFEPSPRGEDFAAGRVLEASSPFGPWSDFAGGLYDGERLAYHRTVRVEAERELTDPTDWQPRDLPSRR
jgi:hypothetical protein